MAAPDAFVEISFRSLTLGDTLRGRIANRGAGHNVYAVATVGRKNAPTMARQLGRSALIDGSANVIDLTVTGQRMAWSHTMPVAKTDKVTMTFKIVDDELDKAPVELFTLAYEFDPTWDDDNYTMTSGEVSVVCEFRSLRGFPPEAQNAVAIGADNRNVIATPAIVRAEITSIKGLFKPTGTDPSSVAVGTAIGALSAAVEGYISEDNLGRVFINRNPENGAWTKGVQYIDVKVQLTITGIVKKKNQRRDRIRVKWAVYVPDDGTDDDRSIHRGEGALLDPGDYLAGAQLGGAGYDNEGTNAGWGKNGVWEAAGRFAITVGAAAAPIGVPTAMEINATNTTYLKPAETATQHVEHDAHQIFYRTCTIRMHCPNRRGDRFIIRVEPIDGGPSTCIPAQTGIITMWDRLDVEYRKMTTAYELPIAAIPQHFEKLFAQMDFTKGSNITDIARLEMTDVATFIDTNFTKRTTAGWFCLLSILRLGAPMAPRVAFTGTARLRNASEMIVDATKDPLKFLQKVNDEQDDESLAKTVEDAEKAVAVARKQWAYEFIDVPGTIADKPSVVLRWPVIDPSMTVNFDQCCVETITLEDWNSRRGVRQRLRVLGYKGYPIITTKGFSKPERDEIARFIAANRNLEPRARYLGEAPKDTLFRKWLHWRAVTPAATNATFASDLELNSAAQDIKAVASRVWIVPHDVQNKFTAGDGSIDHATKHRLMFGPAYRETIEDKDSKAIARNGYGAPDDVTVTIKDLSVERKGESPATTLTVLTKKVSYFAGQTLIATGHPAYRPLGVKVADFDEDILIAVVHELTHAFGMPHKCARWDTAALRAKTCCMNYAPNWMVKAADDTLVADTARKVGSGMCGMHIKEVRRVILEDNGALKSRNWR